MSNKKEKIIADSDEHVNDQRSVQYIATTNVSDYLLRKRKVIINSMFSPLQRKGVDKLYELCLESETEQDIKEYR